MHNILEVQGLTKLFYPPVTLGRMARLNFRREGAVRALDGVSFSLERGRVLGVLGPNGAGKTTLLKALSTLILPDSGSVAVGGFSLPADEERVRSMIGLVTSPERTFYWRLTGRQNLEFFAALYGLTGPAARARIGELLKLFEIDYEDKRFDSYSAGMKQKFALIRGLLHEPELLLLDEPTANLDYTSAIELRSFIRERLAGEGGKTVVFTTHHMDEALDLCGLFMVLHKGRIRGFGTLRELGESAHTPGAGLGEVFMKLAHSEEALHA